MTIKDMYKIYNALELLDERDASRVSFWDCYYIYMKDESISKEARAMFKAELELNTSTPDKLMKKYQRLTDKDDYYYFIEWQVLSCKYAMEREESIYIDDLVKVDDVDARPVTAGDLMTLIAKYI